MPRLHPVAAWAEWDTDTWAVRGGLEADYPMVAPNYAARRSMLAQAAGLGRKLQPTPTKRAPAKRKPGA
ncbi:MucR family transcriptional regulator [Bradyrhizobium sp. Arg314]